MSNPPVGIKVAEEDSSNLGHMDQLKKSIKRNLDQWNLIPAVKRS
jgi:hypothetical protein